MPMDEVKSVIYRYICYYNLRRIYSVNGGYPPEVYRQIYYGTYTGEFALPEGQSATAATCEAA